MLAGDLPEGLQRDAELYAGCVSGAVQQEEYLRLVTEAGFVNLQIQKQKEINLPDQLLLNYLTVDELRAYKSSPAQGIYSITVYAEKPGTAKSEPCCGPTCC